MEIPYTVTARPDTGLWNAKVGIWLFLASEVMLFGGLFSSYVFLRLGADYPWPMHELQVPFGFYNTLILIASSVFVVYAWVSLKMRNYRMYQIWMFLVVACALWFLYNKSLEYRAKFEHYHVKLKDGSVMAGHIADHNNKENRNIVFEASHVTVDYANGGYHFEKYLANKGEVTYKTPAGNDFDVSPGTFKALKKAKELLDAADKLAASGDQAAADERIADVKKSNPLLEEFAGNPSLRLALSPPGRFVLPYTSVESWTDSELVLHRKYATKAEGKLVSDVVKMEIDEIDLREYLRHDDPRERAIADAEAFKYLDEAERTKLIADYTAYRNEHWDEHLKHLEEWKEKHPDKAVPEETYFKYERVFLKDLHSDEAHGGSDTHAAAGADEHHGPTAVVPFADVKYFSNYGPKKNNFYAIYFTMTGLHGLHVLGGAIVLGYFLFFGGSLYRKNPEHLANRVEVGGLFWHFVDLVWIFLFPIFYLM